MTVTLRQIAKGSLAGAAMRRVGIYALKLGADVGDCCRNRGGRHYASARCNVGTAACASASKLCYASAPFLYGVRLTLHDVANLGLRALYSI